MGVVIFQLSGVGGVGHSETLQQVALFTSQLLSRVQETSCKYQIDRGTRTDQCDLSLSRADAVCRV
jgi:hypothetical protein